jgi:hypothetical protein
LSAAKGLANKMMQKNTPSFPMISLAISFDTQPAKNTLDKITALQVINVKANEWLDPVSQQVNFKDLTSLLLGAD